MGSFGNPFSQNLGFFQPRPQSSQLGMSPQQMAPTIRADNQAAQSLMPGMFGPNAGAAPLPPSPAANGQQMIQNSILQGLGQSGGPAPAQMPQLGPQATRSMLPNSVLQGLNAQSADPNALPAPAASAQALRNSIPQSMMQSLPPVQPQSPTGLQSALGGIGKALSSSAVQQPQFGPPPALPQMQMPQSQVIGQNPNSAAAMQALLAQLGQRR